MNILHVGTRILRSTSPLGLIAGGVAAALAIPVLRKGVRRASVVALSGVITIADEAKHLSAQSRRKLRDLMTEVQNSEHRDCHELHIQPRNLAVKATAGALAVSDKAKDLAHNASHELKSIITDARTLRSQNNVSEEKFRHVKDGLEDNFTDIPKN